MVTAVDLGGAEINPKQPNQMATLSDHLEPLIGLMAALQPEEKVILVGHSWGGIAISVAAEKFTKNVAAAVYVTATMPKPGFNIVQFFQQQFYVRDRSRFKFVAFGTQISGIQLISTFSTEDSLGMLRGALCALLLSSFLLSASCIVLPRADAMYTGFDIDPAAEITYDMPNKKIYMVIEMAAQWLLKENKVGDIQLAARQQRHTIQVTGAGAFNFQDSKFIDDASLKAAKLTTKNYGSICRVYIASQEDVIVTKKIQKQMICNYPPQDVKEISDSDHMVMFSKPQELASLLQVVEEIM
ncbi:hypothetical protein POM88_004873 [Heracleum sosnowskyi]|uniref:AB hydrolase-1 domain-containing protein n=1 Tax=Heracleum sosnowskyi TaxID=360622 RepID=A0AAD8JL47_9APIA|nr:hypothetical protein POM88_004873 [Heracleum sosnowskyi]